MFLSNDVRSCFHQHIHHLIRVDKGGISRGHRDFAVSSHCLAGALYHAGHGVNDILPHHPVCGSKGAGHLHFPCNNVAGSPAAYGPYCEHPIVQRGNTAAHQNLQAVYDSSSHDNGIHSCIRISPMTAFSTKFYVYMVRRGI